LGVADNAPRISCQAVARWTLANMLEHSRALSLDEPLLTISDVRGLLRLSRTGVYNLVRRGDLVPIRIGGRVRFSPSDVRAYLARSREIKS
jgi:excisionase family DNA binding protein